jgi:hypothetical protein
MRQMRDTLRGAFQRVLRLPNRRKEARRGTLDHIRGFHSEVLDNDRDITIYLPPGYNDRDDVRYPVLYMHDGQNLFEPNAPSSVRTGVSPRRPTKKSEANGEADDHRRIDNTTTRVSTNTHRRMTSQRGGRRRLRADDHRGLKPVIDRIPDAPDAEHRPGQFLARRSGLSPRPDASGVFRWRP